MILNGKSEIKIRVLFMGTSSFAQTILRGLLAEKYNVVSVITQPDKKVGRKQELKPSPIKLEAQGFKVPVYQPDKLDSDAVSEIKKIRPDIIIVAAYGKIIPREILKIPGFGCVNVHASLLPRYRGPSPIQNALLNGETETGVTLMLMDEGIDTGDIISRKKVPIKPHDDAETLHDYLGLIGSKLLTETLPVWIKRGIEPEKQDDSQAILCQLIERQDGHVQWNKTAQEIFNMYRALKPWPGIYGFWKRNGSTLRIKLIRVSLSNKMPSEDYRLGEIYQSGGSVAIKTGFGSILIDEVQMEGKESAPINEFLRGYPDFIGGLLN